MIQGILLGQIFPTDSASETQAEDLVSELTAPITTKGFDVGAMLSSWIEGATNLGIRIVLALILFALGRYVIRGILIFLRGAMKKRKVEGVAISLFNSIIKILLYGLLGICMTSLLGVQSVSFAAMLASMGLAVGMALSGQLQNFAGGVILLVTKPFSIGDIIEAQSASGVVKAVSLFHTQITTGDNQTIYIPNGILSSGVIRNVSEAHTRRVEWIIGIDYESDTHRAQELLDTLLKEENRVLRDPMPVIALHNLGASSVDIIVRAWTLKEDYWAVYWAMNQHIFDEFNKAGISFPFPQITVSKRGE